MKNLLCFLFFIGISVFVAKAQDKKKSTDSWRKVTPAVKVPWLDTVMVKRPIAVTISGSRVITINPVPIPNKLEIMDPHTNYYRMPVLRLNGQNLAPMPGTENLDKLDASKDSISIMKVKPLGF